MWMGVLGCWWVFWGASGGAGMLGASRDADGVCWHTAGNVRVLVGGFGVLMGVLGTSRLLEGGAGMQMELLGCWWGCLVLTGCL